MTPAVLPSTRPVRHEITWYFDKDWVMRCGTCHREIGTTAFLTKSGEEVDFMRHYGKPPATKPERL